MSQYAITCAILTDAKAAQLCADFLRSVPMRIDLWRSGIAVDSMVGGDRASVTIERSVSR
jgi:hypothetical protein